MPCKILITWKRYTGHSCSNEKTQQMHGLHYMGCTARVALHGDALHGAVLHGAVLHGAALHGAVLHGAALHGAAWHGLHCIWTALHGVALHGVALHGAALHGAELHGAAWHGAACMVLRCMGCIVYHNIGQGWGQVQYVYLVLVLKYIFIST